jgi:hypothetical protein
VSKMQKMGGKLRPVGFKGTTLPSGNCNLSNTPLSPKYLLFDFFLLTLTTRLI